MLSKGSQLCCFFLVFQNKQLLESAQQELKQEKQAKLEAEATIGQQELEIKKLKADLHVRLRTFIFLPLLLNFCDQWSVDEYLCPI